jgi:predicted PurR-regulated permease PerM
MQLDKDKLKQVIFIVALFVLAGFLFWMLKGFLSAFLGALVFYILLRQPLFYLTEKVKRKWNKTLAVAVLMGVSFLILVLPVLLVTIMLSGKVGYLIDHYGDILRIAEEWSRKAEIYTGVNLLSGETVNKLTSLAADVIPDLLSATLKAVADIFVLYFMLYFMLSNARVFEKLVRDNLPFNDENDTLLLKELKSQTISNSIGIVVLAILQALTAFMGYLIFGVEEAFFWAVVTGIMSVIPVVGTAVVWVPLSVFLYAGGYQWQAIALFIYGALVITNIDNVFRFIVQKQIGDIHPLVTFFGVIVGLSVFGFVGLIFGPLLISYFLLLLKIYRNEYMQKNNLQH